MNRALLAGLSAERETAVSNLLAFMGFRVRKIRPEECGAELGELLNFQPVPESESIRLPDEVMVLETDAGTVGRVLERFKRHKLKRPALTCVVTEANREWKLSDLAEELSKEREAMSKGRFAHGEEK